MRIALDVHAHLAPGIPAGVGDVAVASPLLFQRGALLGWTCCDGRLAVHYLENLLGNPYETTLAIAHLVFSGLRQRCPRIRFCFAHGGGTAAMLAGRWQRGFATRLPGVNHSLQAPRDVLRTLFVDGVVHDPAARPTRRRRSGAAHGDLHGPAGEAA